MRIRKNGENMNDEEILLVASASDALGHPSRVKLFRYIYGENMARRSVCNGDLVKAFGLAQATVSQHMSKLVQSGLIELKKDGSFSYYYVNIGMLGKYLDTVKKLNMKRPGE